MAGEFECGLRPIRRVIGQPRKYNRVEFVSASAILSVWTIPKNLARLAPRKAAPIKMSR